MPEFPPKIRLVHCIGTMNIGGSERQLAEIIRRLPRERFEQTLVLIYEGGPLLERVREAGCEVEILGYRPRHRKWDPRFWIDLARAISRFVAILRRRRPHILHGKLYWANILSAVAGRLARVPVVITSRLQMSEYEMGGGFLQSLENLSNRFVSAVLVNSEGMRRDVLAHERIDAMKIHRIYNGLATEMAAPSEEEMRRLREELALLDDEVSVLNIANLHPHKGQADLLRAFALARERAPKLRLFIAGRDQGMRAELERLIAELQLAPAARLLGERRDVPALLALADIYAQPSHAEGFSNSILEAMAAGRPVVATNVGGNAEAVAEGDTGLIVAPGDIEALSEAVSKLASGQPLRRHMGDAARDRLQREFSMERAAEEFADWYESLAGVLPK